MKSAEVRCLDEAKVQRFQVQVMKDIAAASGLACAYIGDRLGLYKAMAKSDPVTSDDLAALTNTAERYVREWLINQAAGGYIDYEPRTGRYSLTPEKAAVLADEDSPTFVGGGFQTFTAFIHAAPQIIECMRTGAGFGWGEQLPDLFEGTERFFRPAYEGLLVQNWIPAVPGLLEKMQNGAVVADIGCGHGVSTLVMARAFPTCNFYGFDSHLPSIERARVLAQKEDLQDRVVFDCKKSDEIPDQGYDVVAFFDCLHDMGDPVGACRRAKATLKSGGTMLIVEPMAGKNVEENFSDVGRAFSGASLLCCTPNAIASGGTALGTIATDDVLRGVLQEAGFNSFHRRAETPFNRVFEARVE